MSKDNHVINVSRRNFLIKGATVSAGLTLGVYLGGCNDKSGSNVEAGPGIAGDKIAVDVTEEFDVNAFVRIGTDNTVTVIMKHLEMGQGSHTGLATLVAEELDADWSQIKYEAAPADAKLYNNLFWGPTQGTGGSTAIANAYTQMRKAGATARHMLVSAAAQQWQVEENDIDVKQGRVIHNTSNQSASFGELAKAASHQTVPEDVLLKDPDDFVLIGSKLHRKDSRGKTNGKAIYTQDIKLPGMLTAVVAHPPRFGANVKSFNADKARKTKGVSDVVQIPNGIAVLADNYWNAKKGRDALTIEWDNTQAFKKSSDEILDNYKQLAKKEGLSARADGDIKLAFKNAATVLEASYEYPYLAHGTMEPMNCVIQINDNGVEIWNGAQIQTLDQLAVAKTLGIKPEQVKINMLFAGGSFGRRGNPHSDYIVEAATIAKAINGKAPVKLVWSREDDTQNGYYRPLYYHTLKAALDKKGNPVAWQHRIVGQSIIAGTAFEGGLIKDGIDGTSVEGAANIPYTIDNIKVDLHTPVLPVPVQWWRSVGSTHTAFSVETFIDELASAAKQDAFSFRRELLKKHPRHLAVMELAAEKAGWNKTLKKGRGRGIAVHESFNTFVAQVAEVTVHDDSSFSVDRVIIAVDCGVAVNPDVIRAQMEGGMGYGLSAALTSKITLKDGLVEQSNFHDYTVLRLNQMPSVEVHIIKSSLPPSGVGEPATPVIAPAVANALYAVTGKRYYQLPLPQNV
ncbi:MAG: twin-arginine translocation pathway signal protein [endosymbiont of Galathealinum brachiosum]|uniref:Twin-arginine translocation pathway signal protein n=1 Tax=endosymbiont of Galathealinum brachiosum TaxID=2200906 RepID=A0A370DMB1_9GAMM|nr:MAG: twin-arginine translocation pathway signal protein [endosymbiont of Galathealinum brachiosum]